MQIKLDTFKEKCEIIFTATVEGEEWKKAQQKATADLAQNVTVKGFRKGKAPLAQAARYIKPSDVLDKAADRAVQMAYNEMIQKNGVRPIMQPELVVNEFKADKFSFKFVVVTVPSVELGQYTDITVEKKAVRVLKADIEKELEGLANKNAELIVAETDYAAVNGDTVVIDFKGFVDGEAFDGGEASQFDLVLGSNTFVPGFEAQLVGVKTNDDVDVNITFPENYVADLANKEALFKVHVTAIKKKVVPAIDDELAKDLDIEGVDTLEQLKEHLKGQIKERKVKEAETNRLNTLLNTIIDNATFHCHEKILRNDAEKIVNDLKNRLSSQGFDLEDYLKMTATTKEKLYADALKQATDNNKRAFVFDKISEVEGINVTSEEVEAKIAGFAKQYNTTVEAVKKQLGNQINNFAFSIRQDKVVTLLKEKNNF